MWVYLVAIPLIMHGLANLAGVFAPWNKTAQGFANAPWIFSQGVVFQSSAGKAFSLLWLASTVCLVTAGAGLLSHRSWWSWLAVVGYDDAKLDSLRRQRPNFVAVERGSKDSDRLTIDFEGRLDGEVFEGGKAEGHQFALGAGRMLKDFEEGLRGAKAGETRSFDVAFPADYAAKNLAGRTAQFTVTG